MRPRFFVTPEAIADLETAVAWYDARQLGLGAEFLRAVRAGMAAASTDPGQFAALSRGIRRVLLRRFPYGLYFVVEDDRVVILAVVHHRQHPRRWQSRW
jgi:plasmid stabilization system protein ParE